MKSFWIAAVICTLVASGAMAQDGPDDGGRGRRGDSGEFGGPGGRGEGGPGEGGPGRGGRFGRFPNPLFEALDADGDQVITTQELRKAAASLKKLDSNGDGKITQDEVRPQGGMFGGDPSQFADRMFERTDQNGDGRVTSDEVEPGPGAQIWQNADQDGDGAVTKEELNRAMEQFRNRFGGGPGGPGGPGGSGFGGNGGFGGRGGGEQMGRLMQNDKNGDGKLSPQEVPQNLMPLLRGADQDQDGLLDARELAMAARRAGGRMNAGLGGGRGPGDRPNGEDKDPFADEGDARPSGRGNRGNR